MQQKTILVTGATGYIGSHTWCVLLAAGYRVIGIDNFSNSVKAVLSRIEKIAGVVPEFIFGDVRDAALLDGIFLQNKVDAVIHFAALKSLSESLEKPLEYYDNNLNGLISMTRSMRLYGTDKLIFSSSAVVYGETKVVPVKEDAPLLTSNPYGRTKLMGEQILRDLERATPDLRVGYLRYFNPVGAHKSGLIGEAPNGKPNNLMPYVSQVAIGKLPKLLVYGGDYPTPDGTGVRDYIHVMDLAQGHVDALGYLLNDGSSFTVNLGTGRGYSVLEVVHAFEQASRRAIPYEIVARRAADIAVSYAEVSLARELLGWSATRGLAEMCADSWRWQGMNPKGFVDA